MLEVWGHRCSVETLGDSLLERNKDNPRWIARWIVCWVAQFSMSPDSRRALQQVLRQCRQELLRTDRQLGYRITKCNLMPGWSTTTQRKCREGGRASNY